MRLRQLCPGADCILCHENDADDLRQLARQDEHNQPTFPGAIRIVSDQYIPRNFLLFMKGRDLVGIVVIER